MRATGDQGGSVVDVFLSEPEWHVRAVTRNPSSNKSKALAARGAQVVSADLDTPSSLESAFKNATAIFAVSDFWGLSGNPENAAKGVPFNVWAANHETEQLKSVVDAADKTPSLERLHFESKAKAAEYAAEQYPELWKKTSIFQAGFFLSNFVGNPFFQPHMTGDGTAEIVGGLDPDVKLPFIAAEEDTGPFVKALVTESAGKNLVAYREWASLREVSEAFTQGTGKKTVYNKLPERQSPFPIPPELPLELDDNWKY